MLQIVKMLESQLFFEESDVDGSEEVEDAAMFILRVVGEIFFESGTGRRKMVPDAFRELSLTEMLNFFIVHLVNSIYGSTLVQRMKARFLVMVLYRTAAATSHDRQEDAARSKRHGAGTADLKVPHSVPGHETGRFHRVNFWEADYHVLLEQVVTL